MRWGDPPPYRDLADRMLAIQIALRVCPAIEISHLSHGSFGRDYDNAVAELMDWLTPATDDVRSDPEQGFIRRIALANAVDHTLERVDRHNAIAKILRVADIFYVQYIDPEQRLTPSHERRRRASRQAA